MRCTARPLLPPRFIRGRHLRANGESTKSSPSTLTTYLRTSRRASIICAAEQSQKNQPRHLPVSERWAGGKGPLSAEFLAVSGALSTFVSVAALLPVMCGYLSSYAMRTPLQKCFCVAMCSFAYGLLLARFDLKKASSLKLTIAFSLLMRFICIPVLSHTVAIAGYSLVKLINGTKTAAVARAAAAAVKAPATVKATAETLSLPAGVLSSLFLLSTTPVGYSPAVAMLSLHVHTTLLAILTVLTLLCFPILPCISHGVSVWAHRSAFMNIGAILPQVAAPPNAFLLGAITSAPVLLGLAVSRAVPHRLAARLAFAAFPIAWMCSLVLLASAVSEVIGGSITGLVGSVALCGGVILMMVLLGRALGAALLLDERAKRTLILYLCTQGTVIGAGISPSGFPSAPMVASALVGLGFAIVMGKAWSKVVIRTSTDVIL